MNFLISNFNIIFLSAWCIFIAIVAVQYFQPNWIKNISYWWLISIAVFIHLFYGTLATLLQYFVWSGSQFTKVFLTIPVAHEVPFPSLLEWTRPLFSGTHGYFALYSLQHFFISTFALLIITSIFVIFFSVYSKYRPSSLAKEDIHIIALSFLIAGYYGAILLVPLAFLIAVFSALLNLKFTKINQVSLSTSFIIVSPLMFLFAIPVLKYFNLYTVFKL